MNTNIFVPSKINVGFQNRQGTYTGKLAYVIYFDEKGKLRKQASWDSWRDENIPNEIYDNEPTEGFVLNKKVGGVEESWGWDVRKTYTRIYDPRGFEFEITVPNLLWILENCDCIKGKGLVGQFVYGWDGKDLVLVPVESPDYKEIQEKNQIIHNNEFIKAKDLIVGATYETLNGDRYVYMGKYDRYSELANYYYEKPDRYCYPERKEGWQYDLDDTWHDNIICGNKNTRYKSINAGKMLWFMKLGNPEATYSWDRQDNLCYFKSVNRKFAKVITTECDKYPEYYEIMQKNDEFSPIDYNKGNILPVAFEDFQRALIEHMNSDGYRCTYFNFCVVEDGRLVQRTITKYYVDNRWYYEENVPTTDRWGRKTYETNRVYIDPNNIEDVYKKFKPMYGEQYLENGFLNLRRGYYGTEK
ncbi:MAG: hypothetical protein IKW51_08340 [Bacteroidales bacterium]|nr:hypothetical protein [Bacteroidales bacterium]